MLAHTPTLALATAAVLAAGGLLLLRAIARRPRPAALVALSLTLALVAVALYIDISTFPRTAGPITAHPPRVGQATPTPSPQSTPAVIVSTARSLGAVPPAAVGVNAAVWDGQLLSTPQTARTLSAVPFRLFRYPGGKTADNYHWRQHCYSANPPCSGGQPNNGGQELNTFDNFMGLVRGIGANALIAVNYGTNLTNTGPGDPREAADWVTYSITKGYDIPYWEIGNEQYFACNTGGSPNLWPDSQGCVDHYKAPNDTSYAAHAPAFAQAMSAAANAQGKSVKIGVDVWEQWPSFSQNVISSTCPWLSFVDFHPYAQQGVNKDGTNKDETDAGLLQAASSTMAGYVATIKQWIRQSCPARADRIEIIAGELNDDSGNPGKQSTSLVNGLYAADVVPALTEAGVSSSLWWDLHNGPAPVSTTQTDAATGRPLYGHLTYGDWGIMSNGLSNGAVTESYGSDWPFPVYYGLREAALLLQSGARMVPVASTVPEVSAHATVDADNRLRLLLINKSPTVTATVPLRMTGFAPSGQATAYTYGPPQEAQGPAPLDKESAQIQRQAVSIDTASPSYTLPPYTMAVLVLEPRGATSPTPTVSLMPTATLSPTVLLTPTPTVLLTPTISLTPTAALTPAPSP